MRILFLLFLLLSFWAQAQKKDTVIKYLDQNLNFTTSKNAYYLGVAIKRDDGWFFYALYPDTTPLLKAYYKDKTLKVKDGPYTLYHRKNIKAQEGTYRDNKKVGVWVYWYPNGQIKDSGRINNDVLAGSWKSWHPGGKLMAETNFSEMALPGNTDYINEKILQSSSDIVGIRNGAFSSWYPSGTLEATGFFENNTMSGTWRWYHENGNKATIETYEKGSVTALVCFDTTGKETGDLCSLSKPALLKTFGDYKEYIYQNLTWPDEAKKQGIEGLVKVNFTITKRGQLEQLEITSSQPILKKAVEGLFATMKEWYPAVSHNRTIDTQEEMIIPFQLNN